MKNMKVLYDYVPYCLPKKASFFQTGDKFYLKKNGVSGWEKIYVEAIVIGEDKDCYITELKEHIVCDTENDDYGKTVLIPIGFHKTRLIEFISKPIQLSIF